MPTFEIISVGAHTGPHVPRVRTFVQRCDSKLTSDRGLFQSVLDALEGTMIHLGHYSEKHDLEFWFCGHAVDFSDDVREGYFRLRRQALKDLTRLLTIMQKDSPSKHVIFLSDYQGGPEKPIVKKLSTIKDFAGLGSSGLLRFNTLYHIKPMKQKKRGPNQPPEPTSTAAPRRRSRLS